MRAEFFRLDAGHLDEVLALEQRCFSMPWTAKQFGLAFEQKVFSAGGRLLASASVYHAAGELEILNVAVLPECRRRGLGRRLLGLLLQVARKMGITRAVLEVRTGNAPAIALYEGLGFARAGRRPRYYADTGEDALIYTLNLV